MKKILIANWKMHPTTEVEARKLAKAADAEGVIVCPPFPFLSAVAKVIRKAQLGAQDVFWESEGAFTGEVSAGELKSLKVAAVIIGHSERRMHLGETDEQIAKKVGMALADGITPIVCVGETAGERDQGLTNEVVGRQLRAAFSQIPAGADTERPPIYIAYEPIWAISTNKVGAAAPDESPEDVARMVDYMQGIVRGLPIEPMFLYGGSVREDNLRSFLACPGVSGALVGGASLKPAEFKKMIAQAAGA